VEQPCSKTLNSEKSGGPVGATSSAEGREVEGPIVISGNLKLLAVELFISCKNIEGAYNY